MQTALGNRLMLLEPVHADSLVCLSMSSLQRLSYLYLQDLQGGLKHMTFNYVYLCVKYTHRIMTLYKFPCPDHKIHILESKVFVNL